MIETTNPTDTVPVIDAHLDAYGEPDAERRAELIHQSWVPQGTLVDPPLDPATGHAALGEMFGVVQSHYPGHTFRRVTGIDQHHEFARYGWELVDADGAAVFSGIDVVQFAADGRLERVTGFIGDLPPRERT
jgi:hypothetical protein